MNHFNVYLNKPYFIIIKFLCKNSITIHTQKHLKNTISLMQVTILTNHQYLNLLIIKTGIVFDVSDISLIINIINVILILQII